MQYTGKTIYKKTYDTPIGPVVIEANDTAITGLRICSGMSSGDQTSPQASPSSRICLQENALIKRAYEELMEYFSGKRREFDLPLQAEGTEFQTQVWKALCEIPYGETRSYREIAIKTGRPGACRAVGGACHRNPVLIMIPCHRVIGSNGSMTGFGCGISVKEKLLALEK